jgi:hypothetical protein
VKVYQLGSIANVVGEMAIFVRVDAGVVFILVYHLRVFLLVGAGRALK